MKLLIDANIILDVLQKREPHYKYSAIIWKLCETRKVIGYVSVLTFMNMVYIMRKELSPEKIEDVYKALALIFAFEDLTEEDVCKFIEYMETEFKNKTRTDYGKIRYRLKFYIGEYI